MSLRFVLLILMGLSCVTIYSFSLLVAVNVIQPAPTPTLGPVWWGSKPPAKNPVLMDIEDWRFTSPLVNTGDKELTPPRYR